MSVDLKKAGADLQRFMYDEIGKKAGAVPADGDAGIVHLFDMVMAIQVGKVSGEKGHRWLGYIQGVLVARGVATLDQMKAMNLAASNNAEHNNIGQQGPSEDA